MENNQVYKTAATGTPGLSPPSMALTGYLYLLMAVYAVSITMIGPMMPLIIEGYQLRLSQGGLIITYQSIGGIIAIILAGLVADQFRKTRLVLGSFLGFGLILFMIRYVASFPILLAVFFALGAGTRMLDTVLNAYISDLHHHRRGLYLNLLHTFFGIGAFIGPVYTRFLLERGVVWNRIFSTLGLVCLGVLMLSPLFMSRPEPARQSTARLSLKSILPLLTSPYILILGIIMVLYVGHQSSIVVWLPMYMETFLLVDPVISNLALSVFWLGIILGRMACSHLSRRLSADKLLLWGGLMGGAALITGLALQQYLLLIICLGLTGFFTGSTIPLLVTIACNHYPENSGTASSIIFLSGALSTLIIPWLVGVVAELLSFQWAMLMTACFFFIIYILGRLLSRMTA